jgi:2-oxoisovalerate dehydrogenase E1 component
MDLRRPGASDCSRTSSPRGCSTWSPVSSRPAGEGFYTISSAGHEDDAVLGALLRTDRPGASALPVGRVRAGAAPAGSGADVLRDTLRSLTGSREDPVSQGRTRCGAADRCGSRRRPRRSRRTCRRRSAPPSRSAGRPARGDPEAVADVPDDASCCARSGTRRSTTRAPWRRSTPPAGRTGSAARSRWCSCARTTGSGSRSRPRPGGSRRPSRRCRACLRPGRGRARPIWDAAEHAVGLARRKRAPVLLHLQTVTRLWGHAGSDVEAAYRTRDDIARRGPRPDRPDRPPAARDGRRRPRRAGRARRGVRARVRELAAEVVPEGHLDDGGRGRRAAGAAPARRRARVRRPPGWPRRTRARVHPRRLPEEATQPGERTLAAHLNAALRDELARVPRRSCSARTSAARAACTASPPGCRSTFGISAGVRHAARRDLDPRARAGRGAARDAARSRRSSTSPTCTTRSTSSAARRARRRSSPTGSSRTPMVVRIAGLAYQKGFGGHFHNDHAIGALRDIPGLVVAVPARGDDAARMLRGCLAMAATDGRVVAFVEPIALYHERDLYATGRRRLAVRPPPADEVLLPGEVGVHHPDATTCWWSPTATGCGCRCGRPVGSPSGGSGPGCWTCGGCRRCRGRGPRARRGVRAGPGGDECRATGGGIADAGRRAGRARRRAARSPRSVRSTPTSRSAPRPTWCCSPRTTSSTALAVAPSRFPADRPPRVGARPPAGTTANAPGRPATRRFGLARCDLRHHTVQVPATSANLGPGFDAFGWRRRPGRARSVPGRTRPTGSSSTRRRCRDPRDDNLVWRSFVAFCEHLRCRGARRRAAGGARSRSNVGSGRRRRRSWPGSRSHGR